jgi:hypothetical protein
MGFSVIDALHTMQRMVARDFEFDSGWLTFWATTALCVLAGSLLCAVVLLFHSKGTTKERWVVAQRACAHYHYRAEREACMVQWRYIPLKR